MSEDLRGLVKTLVGLGLEYLRWTQFLPLLFAWSFLLGAILLLGFLSFQQEGFQVLEALVAIWARFPWLPRFESLVSVQESGALEFQEGKIRDLVVRGWLGISMFGMLLSQGRTWIWGPRPVRSLRRKLVLLGGALGVSWVALLLLVLGPLANPNETVRSVVILTVGCLGVAGVSTYSLLVGAAVDRVRSFLDREPVAPGGPRF